MAGALATSSTSTRTAGWPSVARARQPERVAVIGAGLAGLTAAWELQRAGVDQTRITDNMAGHFMQRGEVDCVIVGADRVVANGDVANKIGTYSLAVLARAHSIPFYVAAPTSTIDLDLPSGDEIPIEQRDPEEVTSLAGHALAPDGVRAAHPAFDVTPHRLVTAIITENGVVEPPFETNLRRVVRAGPTYLS